MLDVSGDKIFELCQNPERRRMRELINLCKTHRLILNSCQVSPLVICASIQSSFVISNTGRRTSSVAADLIWHLDRPCALPPVLCLGVGEGPVGGGGLGTNDIGIKPKGSACAAHAQSTRLLPSCDTMLMPVAVASAAVPTTRIAEPMRRSAIQPQWRGNARSNPTKDPDSRSRTIKPSRQC